MKITLPHVAARIFGEPLAIEPRKLDIIVGAIGPRLFGLRAFDEDGDDDSSSGPAPYQVTSDGIAQIDICGTLVAKSSGMNALSGLTSYADIATQFAAALADPMVTGIALMVNSPGGEVTGMLDLGDAIFAARGTKPIISIVDCAASAAYCLASAADAVVVSRTAIVGSIGVIALHLDQSGADAQNGLRYTAIYAGDRKNDGNPHEALSPEAQAFMQGRIDQVYGMFTSAVARNRGMADAKVRGTQAAIYMGADGINVGLADSLGNADDAAAMLRRAISAGSKTVLAVHVAGATNSEQEKRDHMTTEELAAQSSAAIARAREEAQLQAATISDLCALAGKPELIAGFLGSGKSVAEVRAELMKGRADAQAKTPLNPGVMPGVDAGAAGPHGEGKPWAEVFKAAGIQTEVK